MFSLFRLRGSSYTDDLTMENLSLDGGKNVLVIAGLKA
jgi:hypothetical protein